MITADVSCRILEVDFSGIEAVITGRCLYAHAIDTPGAQKYIRMARLGMHAAVTGRAMGRPVNFDRADTLVKADLTAIKLAYPVQYDTAKRTVHANNFGMTTYGMVEKFPEFFPTLAKAEEFQRYYYAEAPGLPIWHSTVRHRAREHGSLGGPTPPGTTPTIWDHPYGYRHWFHDVLSYQPCDEFTARKWLKDPARKDRIVQMHGRWFKVRPGNDWNRVIAFFPQSVAAGRLKEAELDLFLPDSPNYIGDCYFGRTPLLGPIHDSLLLHIPVRIWDRVVEIVVRVMQTPSPRLPIPLEWNWGPNLPIGVSAKAGRNWAGTLSEDKAEKLSIAMTLKYGSPVTIRPNLKGMEEIEIPTWAWVPPQAGADDPVMPREGEGEWSDWQELARVVT